MFVTNIKPACLAVLSAIDMPGQPVRLAGMSVCFPDLGHKPFPVRLARLRYAGEPIPQGEMWEVAASPISDHDH